MATYSIEDGDGNQITTGLPARTASKTAQRIADERGQGVWLYRDSDGAQAFEGRAVTPKTVDPDAYCRQHGCPRVTCDESHPQVAATEVREVSPPAHRDISTSASNPRPSTSTELAGALDVDIAVYLGDGVLLCHGQATLAPQQADGRLAAFGASPDNWVSGGVLEVLRKLSAPGSKYAIDLRAALEEIERAALYATTADGLIRQLRQLRGMPASAERDAHLARLAPVTDTRPRHKYVLPDGRPILVIRDHDEVPPPVVTFEIRADDPLWDEAQPVEGSNRRFVLATLANGL